MSLESAFVRSRAFEDEDGPARPRAAHRAPRHWLLALWLLFAADGAGIFFAILKLASRDVKARYRAPEPEPRRYASPETVIVSAEGEDVGEKAEDEASEPRTPLSDKMLYKPVLRDWAFYIGALVVTIITTVCTFAWGL